MQVRNLILGFSSYTVLSNCPKNYTIHFEPKKISQTSPYQLIQVFLSSISLLLYVCVWILAGIAEDKWQQLIKW